MTLEAAGEILNTAEGTLLLRLHRPFTPINESLQLGAYEEVWMLPLKVIVKSWTRRKSSVTSIAVPFPPMHH
jgi:hypothetical protein